MAHKKAGGSVKNGRDSRGQRLGIKAGDGEAVQAGAIIVRQRGMTFLAGPGTDLGRDYTRLRQVKSAEEIDWLRIGAHFTDLGMLALRDNLRPGLNERELGDNPMHGEGDTR